MPGPLQALGSSHIHICKLKKQSSLRHCRFITYWRSYCTAVSALLRSHGGQLEELALEAPARAVCLELPEGLARHGGASRLYSLRLVCPAC